MFLASKTKFMVVTIKERIELDLLVELRFRTYNYISAGIAYIAFFIGWFPNNQLGRENIQSTIITLLNDDRLYSLSLVMY